MSVREVHQMFRESVGAGTTEALVRCAVQSSKSAREIVLQAGFSSGQARDVLPYIRRADFETRAAGIVMPGLTVSSRMNSRGTSSFVELSTAKATLTALTRSRRPLSLPGALYRGTRAQSSQTSLSFEEDACEFEKIYGCFVYGGKGMDLTIASVYFPLPDQPLHTISPLNLLDSHAGAVESEQAKSTRPTEEAVDLAMQLKRKTEVSGG